MCEEAWTTVISMTFPEDLESGSGLIKLMATEPNAGMGKLSWWWRTGDGKKGEIKGMNRNSVLFFPVTFCLSGENLSLSQDAMSSVPNGAVRGFTWALARLSGDVALLPLKSQNQRCERADEQEAAPNARVRPYCCVFCFFLTLNDFLPQNFLERSDNSDTNPFFQRAYLLESSPPKKLECGAYALVGFSSTSSWLNNPEGRRQFSNVLDDWTTGIYSLMKTKSESVCVCVSCEMLTVNISTFQVDVVYSRASTFQYSLRFAAIKVIDVH